MKTLDIKYRTPELVVRNNSSRELQYKQQGTKEEPIFGALESLPHFMDKWLHQAYEKYGSDNLLTSTINVTNGCPIGHKSFCGHYCFAHRSWNGHGVRKGIEEKYIQDMERLYWDNANVSIFMSTDTEPFPGQGLVSNTTLNVLRTMLHHPPDGILVHSHTDTIGHPLVIEVLKQLSKVTNLIAGIGFDTDVDSLPEKFNRHHSSVEHRMIAFERLAKSGIKTQASITPLVGFEDFEGFAKWFKQVGAYRVMVGELRKKFPIGGSEKAIDLDIGLPAPSEEEALTFLESLGFPGGVKLREEFYVLLT